MTAATSYWVNFRASGSGLDDATYDVSNFGETYPVSGKAIGALLPQGWEGGSPTTLNDTNIGGRHSQGKNTTTAGAVLFRISGLTSGHTYRLRGMFAPLNATANIGIGIAKDNSYTLINSGTNADIQVASVTSGQCLDIRGNIYASAALWLAAQDTASCYTDYTCSGTTDLYFGRSNSNFAGPNMNAIGIEDLSAVVASPPRLSLLGVG